jgi:hypothetical protein
MSIKSPHPSWATQHRKAGTELRFINNKYYLYAVSSKWDADRKRSVKITGKIIGRITEQDGLIDSHKAHLRKVAANPFSDVKPKQVEYGASVFILDLAKEWLTQLQHFFPNDYIQIFSIAFIRLVYQPAICNMPLQYNHSFLKEHFGNISLTDKHIASLLRKVGQDRQAIVNMMKQFIKQDDMVLVDMTDVISHSKKMDLPHKGYNSRMDFNPQMNLLFIFSLKQQLPAYYRLVPGNIKDVKAFSLSIKESGLDSVVLIADKGFYSKSNIEMLEQEGINYLIPLRRNSPLIDYTPTTTVSKRNWHGYFKYQQRYIWYYTITVEQRQLHLFLDEDLRIEEMRDYLNRIEKFPDDYSPELFEEKQFEFGTIAILAQIDNNTAKEVFTNYKSRNNIEVMFDAYKNILEADRTYMQNEHALEGWLFVNYIAMQWYYLIYTKLKQTNLIKNYSVQSLLTQIRQIKKIRIDDKAAITEYTKATQTLIDKLKIPIT